MKERALGGPGIIFGISNRVGYRYRARGFKPWAVRDAKKPAHAISSDNLGNVIE